MRNKQKGPTLEENTRAKIAKYLPNAVDCALQSYRRFYGTTDFETAKDFSAHHTACKAAIAHIELLLKLAAWARLPREDADTGLAVLMADAQAELDRYNHSEGECDE